MRAVVDIGSNSVKYVLAGEQHDALEAGEILGRGHWITRLGRGLASSGYLDPKAVSETRDAFVEMKKQWQEKGEPRPQLKVIATSAVRDCANPEVISQAVREIFGVELRILDGNAEARLSLEGASLAAKKIFPNTSCFAFLDVGGASTEVGLSHDIATAHSFQAGAVRCHEALGLSEIPVTDEVWALAQKKMGDFFPYSDFQKIDQALVKKPVNCAVAIGGSLVLAAKLCGAEEDPKGAGYKISRERFQILNEELRKMTLAERLALPGMVSGRADVICAGLLCLTHVLSRLKISQLAVTSWGLRYGILSLWDSFDQISKNHL